MAQGQPASLPIVCIGGTDPSGAGLSTDIQVAQSLGCTVLPIVTAVTAQNHHSVFSQGLLSAERVAEQLSCIDFDFIRCVKIGMLGSAEIVRAVDEAIPEHIQIVLDPVLSASSGGALITDDGKRALMARLLPRATVITPNLAELEALSGARANTPDSMLEACQILLSLGAQAVFAKGGHCDPAPETSTDIYCDQNQAYALRGERWPERENVRGTGCAMATAIACGLNQGLGLDDALVMAKGLVSQSIRLAPPQAGARNAVHRGLPQHHRYLPKRQPVGETNFPHFKSCETSALGIYPVVDSIEWIEKLLPLGIQTIQLRIKEAAPDEIEQAVVAAITLCWPLNVRLFINDYWQLAIKHGAYGVHLGQEDAETADLATIAAAGLRLGLSSHCWAEVARAKAINPSYLALGPIFATTSKQMPWIPQGVEAVQQWVDLFAGDLPLVAIGGIDIERARQLKQTGIGSVAMISAITQASDYQAVTKDLLRLWRDN